ncbi:hypothetical protein HRUBRA_02407 [Pseudohaliea rubra DSM 19751]|uniref:Uncharacterized protein n=1 Tax=Pseudohaliea rubra DSM 19751 TaxID=1265313 RepID=A0A095WWE3_9GAMM|nr:hypothetical protein HRUBRA_02407 [Pseudohaliea rubra DSM 19751]
MVAGPPPDRGVGLRGCKSVTSAGKRRIRATPCQKPACKAAGLRKVEGNPRTRQGQMAQLPRF